jgi:hypothetical protein
MNKKNIIILICVIFLIITIIIGWSYFNSEEEVINNSEIVPEEEISDEQLRNTIISLYYINKDTNEIEIESRLIDAKILLNNPYNELINIWLNGANSDKLITGCSKNVKVNNINLNGDCLEIDFSKEFIDEYEGNVGEELKVVYSIVNTVTELTEIKFHKF